MPSSNDGVYWSQYYPHLTGGSVGQYGLGMQDRRFRMLHMKLTEIAQNSFIWEGFPKEVQYDNTRWLEKCLFETALAVFYYDPEWSRHFIMRAAPAGVWNMYGNPTAYLAYGNQYYNKWLDADDCVPIWANNVRYPDFEIVNIYSEVLSELDTTIAINAKNARRTKVIRVNEKSKLSFDNIQRDIDAGKSFIKVLTDLPNLADAMEAIDLGIDSKISLMDMSMLRSRVWNEAQTMLGVNNNQGADKKERLVADEVSGNDEQVMMSRETRYAARRLACDQINEKYGFEVTVRFATELSEEEEQEQMDKELTMQAAKKPAGPQKALTK